MFDDIHSLAFPPTTAMIMVRKKGAFKKVQVLTLPFICYVERQITCTKTAVFTRSLGTTDLGPLCCCFWSHFLPSSIMDSAALQVAFSVHDVYIAGADLRLANSEFAVNEHISSVVLSS